MKKLLIGIFFFSFYSSAFSNKNEINGFGGISWGKSITKYKKIMQLTSDERKSKKFYVRKNEKMSFGDIELVSVIYVFYKGKLSSVILQTGKSSTNFKQTISLLKMKFGKPVYKNIITKKYRWKNKTTTVDLKCFSSSHKCSIIYNSVENSRVEDNKNNKGQTTFSYK